jgi:hypothetical protein
VNWIFNAKLRTLKISSVICTLGVLVEEEIKRKYGGLIMHDAKGKDVVLSIASRKVDVLETLLVPTLKA